MGISKNRFTIGRKISQQQTRMVFILDDGFQYRRLRRDLDIVIIDRSQPLKSNRIFPRGTLREPLSGLRRCHVIVLNGRHEAGLNDPLEEDLRSFHPDAKVFHCEQKIESIIPFSSWKEMHAQATPAREVKSAYLVAALGNPERFRQDVLQLGIAVCGTEFFPDHFKLKPKDWLNCSDEARRRAADAIITTEKDAIKICQPPDFPLLVSVQSTEMSEPEALELVLKDSLQEQL
jgi:tetraacyldisaccharide 4'-kinase